MLYVTHDSFTITIFVQNLSHFECQNFNPQCFCYFVNLAYIYDGYVKNTIIFDSGQKKGKKSLRYQKGEI